MSRAHGCAGTTQQKTPYKDGTTHVIFEPLDFMARLAALVPKPRVNLTRFAPNSKHCTLVIPSKRGKGNKPHVVNETQDQTQVERRAAMSWAQRLKRVFNIDIETCGECGGVVKVIPKALAALSGQALACIEDPVVIKKVLDHLMKKPKQTNPLPCQGAGRHRLACKQVCSTDDQKNNYPAQVAAPGDRGWVWYT